MVTRIFLIFLVFSSVYSQDFASLIGPLLGQAAQGAGGQGGDNFGQLFSVFQGLLNKPPPAPAPAPAPPVPSPTAPAPPATAIQVPDKTDYD